jgi:hypothetical protein
MVAKEERSDARSMNRTSMELEGDREIVIARTFNGPARIVFDAWTDPAVRWGQTLLRGVQLNSV